MITEIHVDGFKSLNDFKLSLKNGLNILVGPNGSGKTNIISLFEFLSYLTQYEIHEAVSHIGGAGSIFSKIADTSFKESIKAEIYGRRVLRKNRYVRYSYSFEIKVATDAGQIYFKKQQIRLQILGKKLSATKASLKEVNWDLDVVYSCDSPSEKNINFSKLDRRKIKNRFGERFTREELEKRLTLFSKRNDGRSLLQLLSRDLDAIRPIQFDMVGGEIFNVIPSKVKLPEDIAQQPGIKKDGSGLASTLYAIKNHRYYHAQANRRLYLPYNQVKISSNIYNKIVALTKIANNSIDDIKVTNNAFDNQLAVIVSIKSSNNTTIELPLSSMSDGTIKWITLITAILSSSQIFSIEEPENFLHPWMQSEITKIMRNSFESKTFDNFALMSTHSETLLNSADPEEVIVVSMNKGITKAKRISNLKLLREEISNTGFGLGYYYLSGGIDG